MKAWWTAHHISRQASCQALTCCLSSAVYPAALHPQSHHHRALVTPESGPLKLHAPAKFGRALQLTAVATADTVSVLFR